MYLNFKRKKTLSLVFIIFINIFVSLFVGLKYRYIVINRLILIVVILD